MRDDENGFGPTLKTFGLLFLCALMAGAAPQDGATFQSGVSLVRVDAEVVDPAGQVVSGLKSEDFRVFDEGQQQKLVHFSFEEEPLDLILMFDMAGSMHGKALGVVRAAELGFHELKKGDRVDVMMFNTRAQDVLPFTPSLEAVNDAILLKVLGAKFGGGSEIERPADDAALKFSGQARTQRKRGILIITDKSGGAGSGMNTVRDLWRADAVLSELILGGGAQTKLVETGANAIVDRTGGAAIVAGPPGVGFQESVHYLRSGYAMYYGAPGDAAAGAERKLRVELTEDATKRYPNVRVRARSGYVVAQP